MLNNTINLEAVSVFAEDKNVFADCEKSYNNKKKIINIVSESEEAVIKLMKKYDNKFDRSKIGKYSLKLYSYNKDSINFMKWMNGKKLPNVKSIFFKYSKSLNTISTTDLNNFFSFCMPDELKELGLCLNASNRYEIKEFLTKSIPKVTGKLQILENELEGHDLKTYFQLASSVKTIQFFKCKIHDFEGKLELEDREYGLERLIFDNWDFKKSDKRVMSILNSLLAAMSSHNYVKTLKKITLILDYEHNLDAEEMARIFNEKGYSLEVLLANNN